MVVQFVPGGMYFLVGYLDEDFLYPKIEAFIYLGTGVECGQTAADRGDDLCFQDVPSYLKYGRFDTVDKKLSVGDEFEIRSFRHADGHLIDDMEGLIEKLQECAKRRK